MTVMSDTTYNKENLIEHLYSSKFPYIHYKNDTYYSIKFVKAWQSLL
jgi:hypothetical protein